MQAKCHSNEEKTIVQTAKGTAPVSPPESGSDEEETKKKTQSMGIGDQTASSDPQSPKRRRSRRSSDPEKYTKDDSLKTSLKSDEMSKKTKLKINDFRKVVSSQLNDYLNRENKYNGIIRIIANPDFLMRCYMEIKSKPGNMSKGTTPETLDGISFKWFEKTAKDMLDGRFQFTPARRLEIPKANSDKNRPLSIGAPREKIVQKALKALLEEIYEPKFLKVSHGFRPNKSTHSALDQLHFKGGHFS